MKDPASVLWLIGTLAISGHSHTVRVYYFTAVPASIPPPNEIWFYGVTSSS